MRLNYEVEWELEDDVIDNIVNEIENTVKQYPDYNIDDYIYEFVENFLDDLDADDCDHFNLDCYLDTVAEEVKKRYLDRKQKATILPATPAEELHSGQIQRIDDFGGICIPMGLRNFLNVKNGDTFEIFLDADHNIILKKYHE